MQFYTTGYDPTARSMLVCRYQRWGLLLLLSMLWGAAAAWWLLDAPGVVTYGVALLAALLTLPILRTWHKRGRRDNWALALDPAGVWLNLRDCEYHEAERGETIVHVPYQELRAVRRNIERYTLPQDRNDSSKHRDEYLELILVRPEAFQIAERIAAEQRREPPTRKSFGGIVTTRVPRTIATVSTAGEDVVRVLYSSRTHRLSPRMSKILAAFERQLPIESQQDSELKAWKAMDPAEVDELLLTLMDQGRIIDATRLARESKGLSLAEARALIESLRAKKSAPSKRSGLTT